LRYGYHDGIGSVAVHDGAEDEPDPAAGPVGEEYVLRVAGVPVPFLDEPGDVLPDGQDALGVGVGAGAVAPQGVKEGPGAGDCVGGEEGGGGGVVDSDRWGEIAEGHYLLKKREREEKRREENQGGRKGLYKVVVVVVAVGG